MFRYADELSEKTALVDGPTGRSYTYGQLYDLARRAAGGLRARGFGKGDVLAIMAPNVPEYAIALHAAALLGGVATTINPAFYATGSGLRTERQPSRTEPLD